MDFDDALELTRQQINLNNSWSAEQAQKQMDFQERMSNTAIQREVADLKAAGINPVLSAKLGGASTPNGAMAQSDPSATSALVNIIDRMLDVEQTKAYGNMYSGYGSYKIEKDPSTISDGEAGGILQFLLGGNGGKEGREGLGKAIRLGFQNIGKTAKSLYNWFSGKPTGNDWVDKTTAKINSWLPNPIDLAKTAIGGLKIFTTDAWNNAKASWNNLTSSYNKNGNLPMFSNTPPINQTYSQPYKKQKISHGLNYGQNDPWNWSTSVLNPKSEAFNKVQKKLRQNPYKEQKSKYDPYKRFGSGKPRTKQKQ